MKTADRTRWSGSRRNIVILSLLRVLFIHASAATGCEFPAVFNFGDSNSDTGGLSTTFGQAPEPTGESFWGHPAGRFCDGRLIIDFIAESLRLPYIDAYLDSLGTNFSHGANFATAGSTIRHPDATIFQGGSSPFPLDVQFLQFSQFKSRSQVISHKAGGVFRDLLPKEEVFSQALYTFDIGQNDLTHCYFNNMSSAEVRANVPDILNHLIAVVKEVYGLGGRYLWIHNTGPFGCLAYVIERVPHSESSEVDKAGCVVPFNKVAQYFNKKLKEAVVRLREELHGSVITYVDVYSLKYSLIRHASKFGFEKPIAACCGHGGRYNFNNKMRCGATLEVNGTRVLVAKSCKNPKVRVSWDGIHYTQAANRWVFDRIKDGRYSDPPTPLHMACRGKMHA